MLPSLSGLSLVESERSEPTGPKVNPKKDQKKAARPGVPYSKQRWPFDPVEIVDSSETRVSEYDWPPSYAYEFDLDAARLKNELLNGVGRLNEFEQDIDPSGLLVPDMQKHEAIRSEINMVRPTRGNPPPGGRQEEVWQRRQRATFMQLTPQQFVNVDTMLFTICRDTDGSPLPYYYWALPFAPPQKQYPNRFFLSDVQGVVLPKVAGLDALVDEDPMLSYLFAMEFLSFDAGRPDFISDWTVTASGFIDRVRGDFRLAGDKGSFNFGKAVSPDSSYFRVLDANNFFEKFKAVDANSPGIDNTVRDVMAGQTGLWVRGNHSEVNPASTNYARSILLNQVEAYYSLVAATQSVGMPIYALRTQGGKRVMSINELAYGNLESNIDRAMEWHSISDPTYKIECRLALEKHIGRRFAANQLHLAELGYTLADGKPLNYLVQKSYKQLGLSGIHLGLFPACVMATDIDPQFSVLADVVTQYQKTADGEPDPAVASRDFSRLDPLSDEVQENDQRMGIPSLQDHGYRVDTECIRFANLCVFSIAAMCYQYDGSLLGHSSYGHEIMKRALHPMKRYASLPKTDFKSVNVYGESYMGAFFCKHFFSPYFVDGDVNGEKRHVQRSPYEKYNYMLNRSFEVVQRTAKDWDQNKWVVFWHDLAKTVASTTTHYGLFSISDPTNSRPYCGAVLRSLHSLKFADLLSRLEENLPLRKETVMVDNPERDMVHRDAWPPFGLLVVMIVGWGVQIMSENRVRQKNDVAPDVVGNVK